MGVIAAIPTDALAFAIGGIAIIVTALVRRVLYWSDLFRGFSERITHDEDRIQGLEDRERKREEDEKECRRRWWRR